MDVCYFIYIIRLKGTRLFYIGVTINLDKRISQHIADISGISMRLRFNRKLVVTGRKPVHIRMAKEIIKGKRASAIDKNFIKSKLSFELKGLAQGTDAAINFENRLLKQYKNNANCLNSQFKSAYSYTRLQQPVLEKSV